MAIHRFLEDWLNDPALADWLVRVSNDEARAYCRYCAIVLRAHKTDLTSHAATAKHLKNVATSTNAPTGPISVQIIVDDNQPMLPVQGTSSSLSAGSSSSGSMGMGYQDFNNSNNFPRSPRVQYPKKYRAEWEQIEEFKDWLARDPTDISKARCKICGVHLRAHKHDLLLHGKSSKHKKCMEEFVDAGNFITVAFGENGEGEVIGEDGEILTQDHDGLKKLDGEDGQNHEDGSQLEAEGVDEEVIGPDLKPDPQAQRSSDINIIRVAAPTPRASPSTPRYGKRRRFNVNDVINSINQNQFTGYELLQICKAAIPKL